MNISPRVWTAALVGLVALNVVLVGLALKSNNTSGIDTSAVGSAAAPIGSAAASVRPSRTPSSTATKAATATATATATTAAAAPLQVMLVAIDTQRAWRVRVGSCAGGGAKIATTADGGTTWADAKAPAGTIVRVRPTDGRTAFLVGTDSSCAAELRSTSDGGGTWSAGSAVGSAWFRDPQNPSALRAPGPSTSRPCGAGAVLDLAVVSAGSARVLCADGLVRSTTNTASSWTDSGTASGAVALAVLAASPSQTYVALLGAPGCAGVQVKRVDQSVATSCIATAVPKDPGLIALSVVDGGGWLTLGDMTMRSTDKLATWSVS